MAELLGGGLGLDKRNRFGGRKVKSSIPDTSDLMPSGGVKGAPGPVNVELRAAVGLGVNMWGRHQEDG